MKVRAIRKAFELARQTLINERLPGGFWSGRLSSSALSTATAVSALAALAVERHGKLIAGGIDWLIRTQDADGGWGDTDDSASNLATTMLVRAALALAPERPKGKRATKRAEDYLDRMAGRGPRQRVASLRESYGADRTFSVPILANAAIAGLVEWEDVPRLPFELARLPRQLFSKLRLHVVSYALPALIAIGQLIHRERSRPNALVNLLRDASREPTLRLLGTLQPESGGFLEATPLTSFVLMSLAAAGRASIPTARRCERFLIDNVREDGSWPIDTNLTTWVTTQAVEALSVAAPVEQAEPLSEWLTAQQHLDVHPYTDAAPGGWAWTDLPGGVPDVDDTSGALVALSLLDVAPPLDAVRPAMRWLLSIQNGDGGWPTFCRGWSKLPFDRSAPDLTAHAIRALHAWRDTLDFGRERRAIHRGFNYLAKAQSDNGSWRPLWFGNQHTADQSNPVYGTARVLEAYSALGKSRDQAASRGAAYLAGAQNADGGWGGDVDTPSTIEETALAARALAHPIFAPDDLKRAVRGAEHLAQRITKEGLAQPAPIGLYFARLWYSERLYPVIWSVGALAGVLDRVEARP